VTYGGKQLVSSNHHILEYGADGTLTRYTDREVFDCEEGLSPVLAVAEDTPYAACWGVGIYEIDLKTETVVHLFDMSNGLQNLFNLDPVVGGDTLWVGTFDGFAAIDRGTRKVTTYRSELGGTCQSYSTRAHVAHGQAWAEIIADAECEGGAANFLHGQGTWLHYGPKSFKTVDTDRIDFDVFNVSQEGVYVVYQDGGPDRLVLSQWSDMTGDWNPVLPPVAYEQREKAYGAYVTFPTYERDPNTRLYKYLTALTPEGYFALSTSGIEQLRAGERWPTLMAANPHEGTSFRLLLSADRRYVIGMSDVINEMGGEWLFSDVTVWDRQNGTSFGAKLMGDPEALLLPPGTGILKDPTLFAVQEGDGALTVTENGEAILNIDLTKKTVTQP
jgi:hypothetical protein